MLQTQRGYTHTHTHAHFNSPLSGTTQVSRYQKNKTNLDFTEARDSEWQWHQLGHMQVCTSLQTDNLSSTPQLSFLQAGCPSCCPTKQRQTQSTEDTGDNITEFQHFKPTTFTFSLTGLAIFQESLCAGQSISKEYRSAYYS